MRPRQPKSWIALIATCSALVYLALQFSPRDLGGERALSPQTFPDTYIEGMTNRAYGKDGQLKHTMRATQVTYFEQGATTNGYIDSPELVFFANNDNAPWHLTARKGVANTQQQSLTLNGDVLAYSDSAEYGRVKVHTDELHIDTDAQYAQTDKPVTMTSARGETHAVGLTADMHAGRMELLSEVKGIYVPQ